MMGEENSSSKGRDVEWPSPRGANKRCTKARTLGVIEAEEEEGFHQWATSIAVDSSTPFCSLGGFVARMHSRRRDNVSLGGRIFSSRKFLFWTT